MPRNNTGGWAKASSLTLQRPFLESLHRQKTPELTSGKSGSYLFISCRRLGTVQWLANTMSPWGLGKTCPLRRHTACLFSHLFSWRPAGTQANLTQPITSHPCCVRAPPLGQGFACLDMMYVTQPEGKTLALAEGDTALQQSLC